MKPKAKKIEDFWRGLKVTRADDDREFQRLVVLGANRLVNAAARGFFHGIEIAIGILVLLYVVAQFGHH
jgi:hypothetical protein